MGPLVTSHPPLTFYARLLPRRLADTMGPVQRGRAPSARLPLRERRCAALALVVGLTLSLNNSVAPSSTVALETVCLRAPAALPRSIRRMAHVKGLCEPPAVLFDEAALRTTPSAARASQAASYFSIVFKETLKPSSECGQAFRHGAS